AEFFGVTLSDLLKSYSMEQLEDEYDKQTAEIAHKRWIEQGKETISMDEILNEFGGL
ncbi:type II toxin-antitoxin system RelB family antitoxin, partial [Enterococcus sp. FR062]